MRLMQLLSLYPQLRIGDNPCQEVSLITHDSRQVRPGAVYVAIRGKSRDGHEFLADAVRDGAVALVIEDERAVPAGYSGAVVVAESTRVALDQLAARFYGHPAEALFCVGVTGTNGKTSTTLLVEAILNRYGWPTGVMGTVNHHLGDHVWESQLTTPDPLTLNKRLAEFRALGAGATAFEVSSHALDQHRADAIPFDVAVFTNLTRDHLDYHPTMDHYFAAKERLFNEVLAQSTKRQTWAILNGDDEWGRKVRVSDRARVWFYGSRQCDLRFRVREQTFAGSVFDLETPRGATVINLRLPGLHNVYNATAAVGVGLAADASLETCAAAIAEFTGVPGRLERVNDPQGLIIFVDYAHTDDALRTVLGALAEVRRAARLDNRIICVFGCGGDRDPGKRPLMARAAVAGADVVFITSDNPRGEDPEKIIADCVRGVPAEMLNQSVFTEVDRRAAIHRALQTAHKGDVILIAGKGHEAYQIIGDRKLPFRDQEVVVEWLRANGRSL